MTRVQAAALVDALDRYMEAREDAISAAERGHRSYRPNPRTTAGARERLITRLADEEPTQPLPGNAIEPAADMCGGCGEPSLPWTATARPPEDTCVWLWSAIDQMWEFSCRRER